MKRLIVFDLDGTLAESKSLLDAEMASLLGELLNVVKAAVISGGSWRYTPKPFGSGPAAARCCSAAGPRSSDQIV